MESSESSPDATLCIANIGPKQRRLRRIGGVVSLTVAVVGLALLERYALPHWTRVVLVLPLWSAALAWLQAREKT